MALVRLRVVPSYRVLGFLFGLAKSNAEATVREVVATLRDLDDALVSMQPSRKTLRSLEAVKVAVPLAPRGHPWVMETSENPKERRRPRAKKRPADLFLEEEAVSDRRAVDDSPLVAPPNRTLGDPKPIPKPRPRFEETPEPKALLAQVIRGREPGELRRLLAALDRDARVADPRRRKGPAILQVDFREFCRAMQYEGALEHYSERDHFPQLAADIREALARLNEE